MKTEAHCPTCGFPFSFWKLAFSYTLFTVYCKNCHWRIVIRGDKQIMWAEWAVVLLITFVLISFVTPRDWSRIVLLAVVWILSFEILEIIVALMIINWGHFSKPEEGDGGD